MAAKSQAQLLAQTISRTKSGDYLTHEAKTPDNTFKCIFLNENVWISIKISQKFVFMGSINNIPSLVHIMALGRIGDKPLSEPMIVRLLTHISVTRL